MQFSNRKKDCLNPLEDEGRSRCEFTMIVAYRKVNLRQTQDRKKKTKLCGVTELKNIREINNKNNNLQEKKIQRQVISYELTIVMFAQTCMHYVYLVIILLCTLKG